MLVVDKDGWISNTAITKQQCRSIEHSQLIMRNSIVLHRTGTTNVGAVLNAWKAQKMGAYFLIAENGKIYQTASTNKRCWHVGKIYARCEVANSCSPEDAQAIEAILRQKNMNWGKRFSLLTKHELKKEYPSRFPHNHDSLGIEIVGIISREEEIYKLPNKFQLDSTFWLLDELVSTFGFSLTDIYAHGAIAHKDKGKSEGAASLKAYSIYRKGQSK